MRRRARQTLHLQVESLEAKVVMSISTVPPLSSVPGGTAISSIGLSPGSAVPAAVEQSMNTLASGDLLETFLSETELIEGSSNAVQQYAEGVILDHRDSDFTLAKLAGLQNVILPYEMNATDTATAAGVLATANTPSFDTAYLNAMVQINQTKISQAQNDIATLNDPQYVAFLQQDMTSDQQHLADAQALLANPNASTMTGSGSGATPPTGSSLLTATDAANLQTGYTVSSFQYYLHQLTNVIDGVNTPVGAFSSKLAFDHYTYDFNAENIAFATNTTLPAGLPGNLEQVGASILATVTPSEINPNATAFSGKLSPYDDAYLTFEIPSHQLMITMDQMAYVQAQNLDVKNLSYVDIFTSNLHMTGAQNLLNTYPASTSSGGTSTTPAGTGTTTASTSAGSATTQYVTSTYETLLDRAPTQTDLSYWTGLLNRGASRQRVYQAIASSAEHRSLT